MIEISLPNELVKFTEKRNFVYIEANTIEESLNNLIKEYPSLKKHLFDDENNLSSRVQIFLQATNIKYLQNLETKLQPDSQIIIALKADENKNAKIQNTYLPKEEILRYSRHLIMPEVAIAGQKKLKNARVLIIGMGGLGSPVGLYLAAAGIGTLGIVDADVVDYTNLQRQVIYGTKDVGKSKVEISKAKLLDLNPKIEIESYQTIISRDNALTILKDYDVIVDGTDNFATRYLVNDACIMLGKPNVYGSIFRFEGQATVFYGEKGPCYRCLYPEPPPVEYVPSCAEGGVLGILPATIGSIQATEAIKLIIEKGESLIGRLLVFDALKMRFKELKIRKNANCPVCSKDPKITTLINYEEFCGITTQKTPENKDTNNIEVGQNQITAQQLKEKLDTQDDFLLLDVRESVEYQICNIAKSTLMPISELLTEMSELDKNKEIVIYCKYGLRTSRAVYMLKNAGFTKVKGLIGGIDLWAQKIDSNMPRY